MDEDKPTPEGRPVAGPRPALSVRGGTWVHYGVLSELSFLAKRTLMFEQGAGRLPTLDLATAMSKRFDETLFGALSVADCDGQMVVIKGRNRLAAVNELPDITMVPCLIFRAAWKEAPPPPLVEEHRRRPQSPQTLDRPVAKFLDRVAQGEAEAVAITEMVRGIGRVIESTSGPKAIACIDKLMTAYRLDRPALGRVLPVLARVCDGEAIEGVLLSGLHMLEHYAAEGCSLSASPWDRRASARGSAEWVDWMRKGMALYGQSSRGRARGALTLLNKGARLDFFRVRPGLLKGADSATEDIEGPPVAGELFARNT